MIVLFTDFGHQDYYIGQLKSVLTQSVPEAAIIDLLHNAPVYNIHSSAYLLAALIDAFPPETIFLCVVDPGVGSKRPGCVAKIDGQWFVGPDNGLFNVILQRSTNAEYWEIHKPEKPVSASFHGRDVFAPIAAQLFRNDLSALQETKQLTMNTVFPNDITEVVYIDHYGNLITGYRYSQLNENVSVKINDQCIPYARTFSDVAEGDAFYYENSSGLLEIAINQGNAEEVLNAYIGTRFQFILSKK